MSNSCDDNHYTTGTSQLTYFDANYDADNRKTNSNFSNFIRSGCELPQQKCFAILFFLNQGKNPLSDSHIYIYIYILTYIWAAFYLLNMFDWIRHKYFWPFLITSLSQLVSHICTIKVVYKFKCPRLNFYLLRTFFPHLDSFFVFFVLFLLSPTFRPNFTSGLLQVIYRDLG